MAKPATKPKVVSLPADRKSPSKSPGPGSNSVSPDTLKTFYRDMLLIRRFEERAGQLYGMGLIGGFCHLYIGQEAVVVGMQSAITDKDAIITSYRDHGHMLACGMDPKGVMAELTGRSGGYSKGKGGSMHMFSREKNFYGGHGIVGAQVPIGTGLAFAHKYQGYDRAQRTLRTEAPQGVVALQPEHLAGNCSNGEIVHPARQTPPETRPGDPASEEALAHLDMELVGSNGVAQAPQPPWPESWLSKYLPSGFFT